jgi:REP element-mobilizing transposase RayT
MPRRLRIEVSGYHHIYNRGVAKSDIFLDDYDKVKFLEILAEVTKEYKFNIHSFCLMSNHYHHLLENQKENLSDGMRQINAKYAAYFNKRHKRVGHLWQDRFKSWYVLNENYLFTLFRYIEENPVKAKMSKSIGEYKYCASYSIMKDAVPAFLQNSFVLRDYHTQELFDMLNIPLNQNEIENIEKFHKTRYKQGKSSIVPIKKVPIGEYFMDISNKKDRNKAILKAYEDDYTKSDIARELSLSVAGVSKIITKMQA